jgi:hypothetical protein
MDGQTDSPYLVHSQSGVQGCTKEFRKENGIKGRKMGGKRVGANRVKEVMYGRTEKTNRKTFGKGRRKGKVERKK